MANVRGRKPNLENYLDDIAGNPELLQLLQQRIADAKKPKGEWVFGPVTDSQLDKLEALYEKAQESGKNFTDKVPNTAGEAAALIGAFERELGIGKRGRPVGSKNKPKDSESNSESTDENTETTSETEVESDAETEVVSDDFSDETAEVSAEVPQL